MEIEFFNQPFDGVKRLGSLLERELPQATTFRAMSAWAQLSGLELIAPQLRSLRAQKVETHLVVGIDGGYATKSSLELALELFQSVHVFHDIGSRIYHPKIYCIEGGEDSLVVVGSSNLSSGGLYTNYEGNVLIKLSNSLSEDRKFLCRIREYWDQFFVGGMPIRPLTNALLAALEKSGSLTKDDTEAKEEELVARAKQKAAVSDLFGRRAFDLPSSPRPKNRIRPKRQRLEKEMGIISAGPPPKADVVWWKKLTRSDARRKDSSSHQRNYVILGKGSFDLDQKTWLRNTLFKGVKWATKKMKSGQVKEIANVPFEVYIDDVQLGNYSLSIDHADHRVADQNNAPTWLNWSELLPLIRRQNFTNWYLVLERATKSYRLRLTPRKPENV